MPVFTTRSRKAATGMLLACAATAAIQLAGCSSALSDRSRGGSPSYADSLIAQSVTNGTYRGEMTPDPTIIGAAREMPPVAATAPAATVTAAAGAGPLVQAQPAPTSALAAPVPPVTPTPPAPADVMPATAPAPAPITATAPGEIPLTSDVGLANSQLNQKEPTFDLSLEDAIARALKNALSIRVEAYNPAIRESQIIQAEAVLDPIVFGQSQWQETDEPVLIPGSGENGHTVQSQLGVKDLLPSGATAQLSAGSTYRYITPSDINNEIPSFQTSYANNLNLTVTQPLLRGFGADVTEANIYLAQKDRRISLATFRRQVITTVADVEAAYLNLVLARTSVDIQVRLLAATVDTYNNVLRRLKIDADRISLSQARAAVEARRAELIRARVNVRNQSDTLKALINDPELSIQQNVLINPTDKPTAEGVVVSTADAIETALRQRTELQEARLNVEKADIVVKVAKNGLLPKLDLTVGMQSNGLDNSFDAAFGSTVSPGHFLDFNAGIRLEFPLGNRGPEAEWYQHKLERSQAVAQMVKVAQTVVQDVKQQLRDLLASHEEIESREAARITAAQELQAIVMRENTVTRTPEFLQLKLDSQSRLATAEQNLIQAMVNYNIALMRFEQSKGTLLEYDRISLDRAPVSRYADDLGSIRFMGQTYNTGSAK